MMLTTVKVINFHDGAHTFLLNFEQNSKGIPLQICTKILVKYSSSNELAHSSHTCRVLFLLQNISVFILPDCRAFAGPCVLFCSVLIKLSLKLDFTTSFQIISLNGPTPLHASSRDVENTAPVNHNST